MFLLSTVGFGIRQDPPVSKLIHACIDNRKNDVISALCNGANINETDEDGSTCIDIAKKMDYVELEKLMSSELWNCGFKEINN